LIFGIGFDLIEVSRFDGHSEESDGLVQKLFTAREIEYCSKHRTQSQNYAARFAAKEALLKALGTGLREGFSWQEIEIRNDDLGKPGLSLHGKVQEFVEARNIKKAHLSLTHLKQFAAAMVVLEVFN
jgi:holo-[acyl-carrier protein] synthase